MFLRKAEGDASEHSWPDLSDDALAAQREAWLVPALYDKTALKEFSAGDLSEALMTLLPWEMRARLEREAPTHFEAPTGTVLAIDYEAEQGPTIAVRLQELFGLNTHPSIAKGKIPLVLELLSPAHRPVQVTRDLPGFWRGSYAAVRSDLRGRYPRHPWPEDPASAMPTRRVKPRGTCGSNSLRVHPSPSWGGWPAEGRSGEGLLPQTRFFAHCRALTPTRHIARCAHDVPPSPQGGGISKHPR